MENIKGEEKEIEKKRIEETQGMVDEKRDGKESVRKREREKGFGDE